MKSVLFSTDFVRRSDGTLTPVEINTNTGHELRIIEKLTLENFSVNLDDFMNHEGLKDFMVKNDLTKIITIDSNFRFGDIFEVFCEKYNFTYERVVLERDIINIPEIDEAVNELVIRIDYDSNSLFDDLYARDMYEFHNLIKEEDFASPVAFFKEDNLDSITDIELSIDGTAPNYVLKPRYPNYKGTEYPKLYRFDDQVKLNEVKNNINSSEFLQKYEISPSHVEENGNTVYYYRSIDLVLSSTLDTLNIFSYKGFNSVRLDNEVIRYDEEVDNNFQISNGMGIKYYPLWFTRGNFMYHFDDTDEILLPEGSLLNANDLKVGDTLQSFKFNNSDIHDSVYSVNTNQVLNEEELNNFTLVDSKIFGKTENSSKNLFINIKAYSKEHGSFEWFDGWSNQYLIAKQGTDTAFFVSEMSGDIEVGDLIYVYNQATLSLIPLEVTEVYFEIKDNKTYLITLSDGNPLFFIKINNTNTNSGINDWFLLQHNSSCENTCGAGSSCGNSNCSACGKFAPGCTACGGNATNTCPGGCFTIHFNIRYHPNDDITACDPNTPTNYYYTNSSTLSSASLIRFPDCSYSPEGFYSATFAGTRYYAYFNSIGQRQGGFSQCY